MNWGDWIREGLDLEPIGEAMTVLLEQETRKRYDRKDSDPMGRIQRRK